MGKKGRLAYPLWKTNSYNGSLRQVAGCHPGKQDFPDSATAIGPIAVRRRRSPTRLLDRYITTQQAQQGDFSVGEVVLEGSNFGTNLKVYFGVGSKPAEIVSVGRNNSLDSITLKLPPDAGAGTYKLIIQNTSGPFLDNNGELNPIFCFGSVTIGVVNEQSGSSDAK